MSHLNILFLKNIFLKNFEHPEDLMEKKIMEDLLPSGEDKNFNGLDAAAETGTCDDHFLDSMSDALLGDIPTKFTSLKNWPTRTNLLCWYCSLKSSTPPITIPTTMNSFKNEEGRQQIEMRTTGIFCSFPCAKSWLDLNFPKSDISAGWADKNNFLRLFFKEFYKFEPLSILPAPNPYIMSKYCGSAGLTEEQYRKKIGDINAAMMTQTQSRD